MKSNYRRIGDFIELVDVRNKDLMVTKLLGLSISKEFIPSVANIIGTNMAKYKIIKKNQFACSIMQVRRDKKMPIALLKEFDEAIISQAYPVFEVINTDELLPDYLMMWFSRSEFDRHACFLAVGGVRGSLEWEDFLDMELPVPSIEKQQEIVIEYNTIVNRIKLNEELNQKLEETAHTLYKHWFVDFEFPNAEGKPYKSSGGTMEFNEELDIDIPEGWKIGKLDDVLELIIDHRGKTPLKMGSSWSDFGYPAISAKNIKGGKIVQPNTVRYVDEELFQRWMKSPLQIGDVIMTSEAPMGELFYVAKKDDYLLSQRLYGLRSKKDRCSGSYLYYWLKSDIALHDMYGRATGTTVQGIKQSELREVSILMPLNKIINFFDLISHQLFERSELTFLQNTKLVELKVLILSKISKVETKTTLV